MQSILLNGVNFNSSVIITSKINHETLGIDEAKLKIPHRSGEKFINYTYASRQITLDGYFKTLTQAQSGNVLDQLIDSIKTSVMGKMGVPLVVGYAGTTRTYNVNVKNFVTTRDSYTITYVPFHLDLEAVDPPFGMGPQLTALNNYTISGSSLYTISGITVSGTNSPQPVLRFHVSVAGDATDFGFTANGLTFRIGIDGTVYTGDYVIDTFNNQVTYNGDPIASWAFYSQGTYPSFVVGSNVLQVDIDGTGLVGTLSLTYNPYYL